MDGQLSDKKILELVDIITENEPHTLYKILGLDEADMDLSDLIPDNDEPEGFAPFVGVLIKESIGSGTLEPENLGLENLACENVLKLIATHRTELYIRLMEMMLEDDGSEEAVTKAAEGVEAASAAVADKALKTAGIKREAPTAAEQTKALLGKLDRKEAEKWNKILEEADLPDDDTGSGFEQEHVDGDEIPEEQDEDDEDDHSDAI